MSFHSLLTSSHKYTYISEEKIFIFEILPKIMRKLMCHADLTSSISLSQSRPAATQF